jgi:hypothetical protein
VFWILCRRVRVPELAKIAVGAGKDEIEVQYVSRLNLKRRRYHGNVLRVFVCLLFVLLPDLVETTQGMGFGLKGAAVGALEFLDSKQLLSLSGLLIG